MSRSRCLQVALQFALVISCFAATTLLVTGCAKRRGTETSKRESQGTYLDEPLILAWSDYIEPISRNEREYIFSLANDTLCRSGRCNDIYLTYITSSSCDVDMETWDIVAEEWRHVGYSPPDSGLYVCLTSPTLQRHSLAFFGVRVDDVLDDSLHLRLRVHEDIGAIALRTMEVNPQFWFIPVIESAPYGHWGLEHMNGHFVTQLRLPAIRVAEVDRSGSILRMVVPPIDPDGIAWDGEHLWLVGARTPLVQMDWDGNVLCEFAVPGARSGDLAWDGSILWLSEWRTIDPLIWAIDPVASCDSGKPVVIDSFPRPGFPDNAPGLVWDGAHLLQTCQNYYVYRMTREGHVVDSMSLPVSPGPIGATWDGCRLCLLANGMDRVFTDDNVIACFLMR